MNGLTFNQFFPWQIDPEGTEEETLNHVGRQELYDYMSQSFTNDSNLHEFYNAAITHNPNRIFSAPTVTMTAGIFATRRPAGY